MGKVPHCSFPVSNISIVPAPGAMPTYFAGFRINPRFYQSTATPTPGPAPTGHFIESTDIGKLGTQLSNYSDDMLSKL
ncbi:hypothetical protein N9H39_01400 [Gammaproteobacteria bacterium]|nr:hypothetical protein [Gammaproteobacteria bacterium]